MRRTIVLGLFPDEVVVDLLCHLLVAVFSVSQRESNESDCKNRVQLASGFSPIWDCFLVLVAAIVECQVLQTASVSSTAHRPMRDQTCPVERIRTEHFGR